MRKLPCALSVMLLATLLTAPPVLAKKHQDQQAPSSYGPPAYAGSKSGQTPPYGPPTYAGPKTGKGGPPTGVPGDMPPGQRKKSSKHAKKHRHSPPDHAPAWGYRNQQ